MERDTNRRAWVLTALDQFESRLLRYAQRLVGDLDEARDVVQFVFLRLCDQSPAEINDRLAQWLYTVCRNRALDVLRAKSVGWAPPTAPDCGGQSPPYSREDDPADSAEDAELHALLRQLVARLPENQREALDLWADGFSYAEISQIIEKQVGHIRVLVHRGLRTLREHPQVRAMMNEEPESKRAPFTGLSPDRPAVYGGSHQRVNDK